jgi:hypothetical protein
MTLAQLDALIHSEIDWILPAEQTDVPDLDDEWDAR